MSARLAAPQIKWGRHLENVENLEGGPGQPSPRLSSSVQFSCSVCPTLCDPMDCKTPGFPVHRQLPQLTQTHAHGVGDAIQPSHLLSSTSPPAFNLSCLQPSLRNGISCFYIRSFSVVEFYMYLAIRLCPKLDQRGNDHVLINPEKRCVQGQELALRHRIWFQILTVAYLDYRLVALAPWAGLISSLCLNFLISK